MGYNGNKYSRSNILFLKEFWNDRRILKTEYVIIDKIRSNYHRNFKLKQ